MRPSSSMKSSITIWPEVLRQLRRSWWPVAVFIALVRPFEGPCSDCGLVSVSAPLRCGKACHQGCWTRRSAAVPVRGQAAERGLAAPASRARIVPSDTWRHPGLQPMPPRSAPVPRRLRPARAADARAERRREHLMFVLLTVRAACALATSFRHCLHPASGGRASSVSIPTPGATPSAPACWPAGGSMPRPRFSIVRRSKAYGPRKVGLEHMIVVARAVGEGHDQPARRSARLRRRRSSAAGRCIAYDHGAECTAGSKCCAGTTPGLCWRLPRADPYTSTRNPWPGVTA